ncbi:ABC transporter permease [Leadbetterella sp. DM7]|uniref:ABC transporter permease n=1 Tax=Leadbetterella sp. DM7 TaxID=3235085 RepID=UPI00349E90A1
MKSLIKREFKLFFKDSTLVSVFLLAPVIYALLIGMVYKSGKVEDLPVIIIDQDNTPLSNQLTDMLSENEKLKIVSVQYSNTLTQEELIREKAVLAVVIPDRFEADILQKRYPEINTYINTTNLVTANLASGAAQMTIGSFSAGVEIAALKKKEGSPSPQYEPFKANYIRLFNPGANYFTYMWPGMIMVVFQQVLLLGLAVSFSREFEQKTFRTELLSRTHSAVKMILVKVIPFWVLSVGIAALFYFFHQAFNAPMPYTLWPFAVNTAIFVVAVSMLGVCLSILFKDSLRATQILMLMAAPAFIIGGYSWPLQAMPAGVQLLASAIPLTPFLEAHKMMLFQKAAFADILPHIYAMLLQILVYGTLSFLLVKYHIRKSMKSAVVPE